MSARAPESRGLVQAFSRLPLTQLAIESLRARRHRAAGGLWGASASLLLAAMVRDVDGPLLAVTADDGDADDLAGDLQTFLGRAPEVLPRQEFDVDGIPDPTSAGRRARCLVDLIGSDDFVLIASLDALLQPVPNVEALSRGRLMLRAGDRADRDHLLGTCVDAGLRRVPVVLAPGEVSLRGDVLDVYPLAQRDAVRIEFLDHEIESIRSFDPASQRSLAVLESVALALGGAVDDASSRLCHVVQHVHRPSLWVAFWEPLRIDERKRTLTSFEKEKQTSLVQLQETLGPLAWLEVGALPSADLDFKILSAGSAVGAGEADPLGRLRAIRGLDGAVQVVCRSEAERDRLRQAFDHKGVDLARERVDLTIGALSRGFRIRELGVTVLSNVEFAGVPAAPRLRERREIPSKALQSFFELGPGDLVVHAVHGIALFEGTERVERGDSAEDHLRLLFRDDVRLLVPVSKIHLVQKYVGAGEKVRPQLDKIGGKGFARRRDEVRAALFDMAADLLELEAKREQIARPAFPPDPLEQAFLDAFPFEDTPDQQQSWQEIGADLSAAHPMDRLLCGDVGFGKTEVAMRAAFRVAVHGRQVAVLAPTTVLAEQHRQTFAQRFEPHGLRVELLSRFRTGKSARAALGDLAVGKVDVVVGTHRILGEDVRFADLGLLVVDEEQRFGVRQKEQLKRVRLSVDVLAMTATPIPRTLHASLLGIRAISTLRTPPPGRRDVETHVVFRDDHVVQDALLRELARGGQVFFLHNRIEGLAPLRDMVARLAPDARVAIGHGQLTEAQMETTLRAFVRGEVDVLVCTTIVENGLDLPRANTILIDRAELFGLAELHQLRGRVGRGAQQAYCYLMMDRTKPPPEDAKRRLKVLEELTHLGAGFAIAIKDLEIRGAGNLLGPQQSGHIAAVGYEMYCQLLRAAVDQAKHQRPEAFSVREVDVDLQVRAFLPDDFVADPRERLELLREMDGADSLENAAALRAELADRFGRLPPPVDNLLRVFLLKHLLIDQGIDSIQRPEADRLVVRHPPGRPLGGAWLDAFADVRPVEAGKTHLILPAPRHRKKGGPAGDAALDLLLDALSAGAASTIMPRTWRSTERSGDRASAARASSDS